MNLATAVSGYVLFYFLKVSAIGKPIARPQNVLGTAPISNVLYPTIGPATIGPATIGPAIGKLCNGPLAVPAFFEHILLDSIIWISAIGVIGIILQRRHLGAEPRVNEQSKAHLHSGEGDYAALLQDVPVGIFRCDASGRCTYVNPCWCQMTGRTLAMAAADGWQQSLHPGCYRRIGDRWIQALQTHRVTDFKCLIRRLDRTQQWVYIRIAAEQNKQQQAVGYIGTMVDIGIGIEIDNGICVGADREAEAVLAQDEVNRQTLVGVLPDLIMRISRTGVFLEFLASPNFRVLGEPKDWVGKRVADMLPLAIAEQRLSTIEQALQSREVQIYEQNFAVEGDIQIEEVRVVPYKQDEVLFLVRDVSDRRRAELALGRSEAQSRSILAAIPDIIVRVGADGIYREFFSQPRDFAVVPTAEIAGRSIAEILPADLAERQQHYLKKALETGELQVYEQTLRIGDHVQEEEVRVIRSGPDEALFMIRNISSFKQTTKALEQKLKKEQTISQIVQAIRNSLDLATIFATATAETSKIMAALNCSVVQYLPEQQIWKVLEKYRQDLDSPNSIGFEISDTDNPFAEQLKQFKVVKVRDTRDIEDPVNRQVAQVWSGAWLLIPLVIEGEIWGSLCLSMAWRAFDWKDWLVDLARAVADQLEVAIQQAQLYQQVKAEKQKLLKSQAALAQAQQIARMGNWELDIATQSVTCSQHLLRIFGQESSAAKVKLAESVLHHVHPEDWPQLDQAIAQTSADGIASEIDLRFFKADGSMGYLEVRIEAVRNETSEITKLFGISSDISDRKRAEIAIKASEQRFHHIAANLPGVLTRYVLYLDGTDSILYISPGCYDLCEVSAEEIVKDAQILWNMVVPEDLSGFREAIATSARELTSWTYEWRITTPSGRTKWLHANGRPERRSSGEVIWDTIVLDVSDRIKAEQQLKHDSLHDSLTGLSNRSLLIERLDLSLKKANRHSDYQFAVLFLDLDNFKVINDSLGHLVGDELLRLIATLLSETIRETDLAARLGGDEFVVLLDELDHEIEAEHITQRILSLLKGALQVRKHEVFISTSIGIVVGSEHYQTPEELLRDADLAMYSAKQSGRGRFALFNPTMHSQALQRLQTENDLRRAINQKEFVLLYQPIVNLETRAIWGFEALVRWQHPHRGLLLPTAFIDVAEETGLIEPLGEWILQTACQQLAQWKTENQTQQQMQNRPLRINVNLSIKQLQPSLLLKLEENFSTCGIEPITLGLEITESMLAKDIDITAQLLQKIKEIGVRLCIDDFGTGYSSLSYLHQLPVDSLKIDQSFVSLTSLNERHQTIAETIATLGKLLKLEVVAEGIETDQQLAWLRSLGCQYGQGYLFSEPVTAEKAARLLHGQATNGSD